MVGCVLVYGVWMFFFQNVVHKSRHVLPLLALLLPVLAEGAAALWRGRHTWARGAVLGAAGAYAAVALVLAVQHQAPTAIAQAKRFVEAQTERPRPTRVASVPLVNTYLRSQQVDARFLSIEDSSDVRRLRRAGRLFRRAPPAAGRYGPHLRDRHLRLPAGALAHPHPHVLPQSARKSHVAQGDCLCLRTLTLRSRP
jgi:hypothetical protein